MKKQSKLFAGLGALVLTAGLMFGGAFAADAQRLDDQSDDKCVWDADEGCISGNQGTCIGC